MWNKPRLTWINDGFNQTLVAAVIAGAIATYLIVGRGWGW